MFFTTMMWPRLGMPDCSVSDYRIHSHLLTLCLSWQPLQSTAFYNGSTECSV